MIEAAKRGLAEGHIQTFLAAMRRLGYGKEDILNLLRQENEKEETTHGDFDM